MGRYKKGAFRFSPYCNRSMLQVTMRFFWIAVILALIGFAVAFEEEDHSEDFEGKERHRRWLFTVSCSDKP